MDILHINILYIKEFMLREDLLLF
jgi:hypothetical protein